MAEKKSSDNRHRNFATIVYPESAPPDWQDILSDHHVPAFISPIHDKDVDKNGKPKKPHYHVMLMFDGKKTDEQAKEIFSSIGGVGMELVNNVSSYARYLCHLDDAKKVKYNISDVIAFGGADYSHMTTLASDRHRLIGEMKNYCRDNHVYAFSDLMDYADDNHPDWFKLLCDSSAYVMDRYIKGLYFKECNLKDVKAPKK